MSILSGGIQGSAANAAFSDSPFKMSLNMRLACAAGAFLLGLLMASIGNGSASNVTFAICYVGGILLATMSTIFLVGPKKQMKFMFKSSRRTTSLIFLGTCGATMVLCFFVPHWIRSLLYYCSFAALLWYVISFIPGAHKMIISCCKGIMPCL
ncbi:vesicle transport protein, SFT2-like [Kipferlia bialata]|uniref:Vesicle transport protein n=1 Tax=Kipferlia bialata TaxID=797122 RepID=A0A9K3GH59_9EUKA|nr:vesicle transport protein, SFT2-like [Kipferlia bialata]|eukprot:g4077.t1